MIGKILFTAAVIAIVYLLAKGRGRRQQSVRHQESLPGPHKTNSRVDSPDRIPRFLGYILLGIMLAASCTFIFMEWRDQYRVVTVRVINTNTGGSVTYQARRGDVDDRSLETIDGRRVVLAEVERMELGER